MARAQRAQSLVEFAVVAPIVVLVLLIVLDFGRGFLYCMNMATAASMAARQAVLQYNSSSNLSAPSCNPTACTVPGVLPVVQGLGAALPARPAGGSCQASVTVPCYQLSSSSTSPPWYGAYQASSTTGQPGTITLASGAAVNRVYVFIYELDPATGLASWPACDPCGLRGGGKLVVVDLLMRWQPFELTDLGLSQGVTFHAQAVHQEEW